MKTIMVVDDESTVLETVKSYLDQDEFNVVTVGTSRQGLALIEKERNIDLILVDTSLPASDKTGFFSMKPDSRLDTQETGNFLEKPFTKDQLVSFIRKKIK